MTKKFPNGFTSWVETHYEISSAIALELDKNEGCSKLITDILDQQGHGGMYELSESLTDEFETMNEGREWDGEFFDELWAFIESKF